MFAEEFNGSCPSHFQEPFGKTLKISFIGIPPYISYNPLGGSEFIVTKIIAEKFRFIPKFIPVKSIDDFEYQVRNCKSLYLYQFLRLAMRERCCDIVTLPVNTFQISTKQMELGIGQTGFADYRYKFLDFLPTMYMDELILASQKPKEITSYDTITIPFHKYVWIFTLACIITQFMLLVTMQNLWSSITGANYPCDFLFEGLLQEILSLMA